MTEEKIEIINEKDRNEAKGLTGRKYLTCQKYGDVFEVRDGLACRHQKVVCKFRLTCPIYSIGKND
jgi:nitrite reductase/ring-hydroxylating ferredoxin subunit